MCLSHTLSYIGSLCHFTHSRSSPRYRPKPLPCGVVYLILFSIIPRSPLFSHTHIMLFLTINPQTPPFDRYASFNNTLSPPPPNHLFFFISLIHFSHDHTKADIFESIIFFCQTGFLSNLYFLVFLKGRNAKTITNNSYFSPSSGDAPSSSSLS